MQKRLALLFILALLCACNQTAHEPTRVRITRENAPAVVTVNILHENGSAHTATGFVLTPEGLIATNRHVTDNALYLNITFNNGTLSGEAVPVARAKDVDLALLKIKANYLSTVRVGDASRVLPGQSITVIGNPRRLQNTVTDGIISQVRQKPNGIIWHQISAPISPSSSGSPVFNEAGEVISVAFGSFNEVGNQNLNFAVPANYLLDLVRSAGYTLPVRAPRVNPFVRHVQKSWSTLTGLFRRS